MPEIVDATPEEAAIQTSRLRRACFWLGLVRLSCFAPSGGKAPGRGRRPARWDAPGRAGGHDQRSAGRARLAAVDHAPRGVAGGDGSAARGRRLVISGISGEQYQEMRRAGAGDTLDPTNVCEDLELAIARGVMLVGMSAAE